MQKFEIIYDGTQEGLEKQIAERLADDWQTLGEITKLESNVESDFADMPQFVYFAQIVAKELDGEYLNPRTGIWES